MKKYILPFLLLALVLTACGKQKSAVATEVLADSSYLLTSSSILEDRELSEESAQYSLMLSDGKGSIFLSEIPADKVLDGERISFSTFEAYTEYEENKPYFPALRRRDDGSWAVVTLNKHGEIVQKSRFARKDVSYYSADGKLQWTVTFTACFQYDGLTAACTDGNVEVTVADENSWEVLNWAATEDGCCSVTFRRETLGVPTSTPTFTFQLTCDPDGSVT